ncbi:YjeJ family protein [Klebsiella pneumoniae]|uniref:YjeJ family protein n=1 Tax=Klebsiella pneumoniae TaxID=573 RepID=UPI000D8536E2|nr:YjeJ family protein [Klebsiella pneumoniae]SQC46255.1 Uncharacterised protein [Klebsiella pneumoniae]HBY9732612.1 hypothetical protein [Klebsiella pneumoniae]
MQGTFIGFNTAGITYDGKFLALLLKVKNINGIIHTYYLQAQALTDFLLILQSRMPIIFNRIKENGESYKDELFNYNQDIINNIPALDMNELQNPIPERRIMSITLKPGEMESTLILILQDEKVCTLKIDDKQIEALIIGIQQALKTVGDQAFINHLSSNMDFLICHTIDLRNAPTVDYQQHPQEDWKLNLFSHYLGVLYCCETDEGKKIVSGAVVKTSAPHLSELENNVVTRIIEKSPKLKAMHAELAPCQIFSTIIPSQPGRMLSLEECLRPLHAFYLEKKAELSA